MRQLFITFVCLLELSLNAIDSRADEKPLLLGVIEEICSPCTDQALKSGRVPTTRVVRPLFTKSNAKWTQAPKIKDSVEWTVAFDGKDKGKITTSGLFTTPGFSPENKFNLQQIGAGKDKIPEIPNPNKRFGSSAWVSEIQHRPLVAVSGGDFQDPDKWKKAQFPAKHLSAFQTFFASAFPAATNCDAKSGKETKWTIKPSDVAVITTYKSKSDDYIIEAKAKGWICSKFMEVEDESDDEHSPSAAQIFYFRTGKEPAHLGGRLRLLDAGDYDKDGKSEVLFQGALSDSYILFADQFKNRIESQETK